MSLNQHFTNEKYYKLPGGGIEKSKDKETALKRSRVKINKLLSSTLYSNSITILFLIFLAILNEFSFDFT